MDSATAFFSSIITALSAPLVGQINDVMGAQPQAVATVQDGVRVTFTHQNWMIRDASVCAEVKDKLLDYSRCTQAAKAGFVEACDYLEKHPLEPQWKYLKVKGMYCNAAKTFTPKVATVSASAPSAPVTGELLAAKKECSFLTAAALGNPDPGAVTRRDMACAKYRKLQGNPAEAKRP